MLKKPGGVDLGQTLLKARGHLAVSVIQELGILDQSQMAIRPQRRYLGLKGGVAIVARVPHLQHPDLGFGSPDAIDTRQDRGAAGDEG